MNGIYTRSYGTGSQLPNGSGLFAGLTPGSMDEFSQAQEADNLILILPEWPALDALALDETDFIRVHVLTPVVDAVRDALRERFGEDVPVTRELRSGDDAYLQMEAVVPVAATDELLDAEESIGELVLERFGFDTAVRVNVRLRRP